MKLTLTEHNAKFLILADHRANISSTVIQALASRISRRNLIVSTWVTPDQLNWDELNESARDCFRMLPGLESADPEQVDEIVQHLVDGPLVRYVERLLGEFQFAAAPRAFRGGFQPASIYPDLVRGLRKPLFKDAAAILAAELVNRGQCLIKTKVKVLGSSETLCRELCEELADNEHSEVFWAQLTEEEKVATAQSVEPFTRPLTQFIINHIKETSLSISAG